MYWTDFFEACVTHLTNSSFRTSPKKLIRDSQAPKVSNQESFRATRHGQEYDR